MTQPEIDFEADGETFDKALDGARLGAQMQNVRAMLCAGGGQWWTLRALSGHLRYPEASISARLRDLRKPRFGGHTIERRRVQGERGLYEYRMVLRRAHGAE